MATPMMSGGMGESLVIIVIRDQQFHFSDKSKVPFNIQRNFSY